MVQIVDVFLNLSDKRLKVGRLAAKSRTIYFEYEKDFLQTGIELSPYKLPLKSGVFNSKESLFEGLCGVFADSLPDGWGRLLLDRYFLKQGIKQGDITPLDRLCYIGSYGTGALSYEPVIKGAKPNKQAFDLDSLANSSLEILRGSSFEMIDTLLSMGGSSAGARPKIMVQINENNELIDGSQQLEDGFEHYMVKFSSSDDIADMGNLEYAYSLMAKDAKIEMPKTKLLQGREKSYFAIKRFDRVEDRRVHMHSVAGLVHSDFRFPSLDYDDLLMLTLDITKDKEEQVKMFRLAVFNLLAHNRDDHAKNFSFLLDENGGWKLAPAYDLTFSFGPGGEHSTTYLGVGKTPTIEHLKQLAIKHDIKDYDKIIAHNIEILANLHYYFKISNVSNNVYKLVLDTLRFKK